MLNIMTWTELDPLPASGVSAHRVPPGRSDSARGCRSAPWRIIWESSDPLSTDGKRENAGPKKTGLWST